MPALFFILKVNPYCYYILINIISLIPQTLNIGCFINCSWDTFKFTWQSPQAAVGMMTRRLSLIGSVVSACQPEDDEEIDDEERIVERHRTLRVFSLFSKVQVRNRRPDRLEILRKAGLREVQHSCFQLLVVYWRHSLIRPSGSNQQTGRIASQAGFCLGLSEVQTPTRGMSYDS